MVRARAGPSEQYDPIARGRPISACSSGLPAVLAFPRRVNQGLWRKVRPLMEAGLFSPASLAGFRLGFRQRFVSLISVAAVIRQYAARQNYVRQFPGREYPAMSRRRKNAPGWRKLGGARELGEGKVQRLALGTRSEGRHSVGAQCVSAGRAMCERRAQLSKRVTPSPSGEPA